MGRRVKRVARGAEFGPHLGEDPKYKKGDWYQMWQTVSDNPYTPAFETPEELARWCATHPWGAEQINPVSYASWLKFIKGPGLAQTFVMDADGMHSGVEYDASNNK